MSNDYTFATFQVDVQLNNSAMPCVACDGGLMSLPAPQFHLQESPCNALILAWQIWHFMEVKFPLWIGAACQSMHSTEQPFNAASHLQFPRHKHQV